MIKKVLAGIGVVVVLFVLFVATRPAAFHIERSITMNAPAERAFAQVNDLHAWAGWSPFEKLDPNMTKTYRGPASGTGAECAWVGNSQAGEGKMTIVQSEANAHITMRLEFLKPFAATNTATFTFVPDGGATKVTWGMDGERNFVSKAICLFMDMDKMVGGEFDEGLASLKTIAESGAAEQAKRP